MREIGLQQARGRSLVPKTLFLQGIGSRTPVQRRLTRLKLLGVIQRSRAAHDKRILHLTIAPHVWAIYRRMGRLTRQRVGGAAFEVDRCDRAALEDSAYVTACCRR